MDVDTGRKESAGKRAARGMSHFREEELDRIYEISTRLIRTTTDPRQLMDLILDEYIDRFEGMPGTDLAAAHRGELGERQRERVEFLTMFATQAVLLKEHSELYAELKKRNEELDRTTRSLARKNQKLAELNEYYMTMLGFVSHELRSPLVSVFGFADLLAEGVMGDLSQEQNNAVALIRRSASELLDMIRNYLDLSKIEMGELKVTPTEIAIHADLLKVVFDEIQAQAQRKGMRVTIPSDAATRAVSLSGDRDLLRMALTNLVANAVKYGAGGTEIRVDLAASHDGLTFSVFNEGEGVPREHLKTIFEKFSRVERMEEESARGAGLGLFNTRYIVEAHGGKIWAESEYGKWFRVSIWIPRDKVKTVNAPRPPEVRDPAESRVLVKG